MSGPYSDATIESFELHGSEQNQSEQRRIINQLQQLDILRAIDNGTNLLFIGACGTGKDHLLFGLVRKIFAQRSVLYINGADFRLRAREARRDGSCEQAMIDQLASVQLLCLSDPAPAGGASLSESQADLLYHVVQSRSFKGRPTWATINLPCGDVLRESATRVLTAQVWDRLKHQSIIVPCRWESYRKPERVL